MTLYASATDAVRSLARKTLPVYAVIAGACLLVTNIYAIFSHGVRSAAMDWMFLFPLCGGVAVLAFPVLSKGRGMSRAAFNLYNSALASMTVAGLLDGVIEIAGASTSMWGTRIRVFGAGALAVSLVWQTARRRRRVRRRNVRTVRPQAPLKGGGKSAARSASAGAQAEVRRRRENRP